MKNISIKWKIFFSLLGFSAALLVFLWFFQVVFLDDFYKSIKVSEINGSGAAIAQNINADDIDEIMEDISKDYQMCGELISSNMTTLYSSHIPMDCAIHKMSPSDKTNLYLLTQEHGGKFIEYFNEKDKKAPKRRMEQTIIYSSIIPSTDGEVMLLLNSQISPVTATVTTLRTQFLYIIAFMVLFSVILAFIISRRVSKPIEKVNQSAKSLALGKYDITFESGGYKEIGELSNTLNIAAKELSKVENLRKDLIANISHDLRTPLTLISGYAEVMRDLPKENTPANAQVIIDEAQRLTTLVNDVLDISKLQSGTQTLNITKYNLTASLKEVAFRMNALLKNDSFTITFNYDKDVFIMGDENKISQVFYNLLINAINYTGDNKTVTVNQICSGGTVKIEVCDTGEGIAQEDLPYIWERYYKVDKVHKRAVAGSGIGLSIVKSILEAQGGLYGVKSVKGSGSIFWFELTADVS